MISIVDTCGVHNLQGMPGLVGGLAAIFAIPGIACAMAVTLTGSAVSGFIVRATGAKHKEHEDAEQFEVMPQCPVPKARCIYRPATGGAGKAA